VSPLRQQNLVAAALVCIFCGYIAVTLSFGPNARLVPLPIALVGLACLIAQILRQNLRQGPEPDELGPLVALADRRRQPSSVPVAPPADPRGEARRERMALGIVALFVLLVVALGPVPAVFLFSAGYLSLTKRFSVATAVAIAAAFAAAIYLLFVVGLELELYHGLLEPLVSRL